MSDVLAFLAAVHAADEQAAREAEQSRPGGHWLSCDFASTGAGAHIARHDPQSVLARVDAERALVALHEPVQQHRTIYHGFNRPPHEQYSAEPIDGAFACGLCSDSDDGPEGWPCPSLRVLAGGYQGREGWRAEWTPDGVEMRA